MAYSPTARMGTSSSRATKPPASHRLATTVDQPKHMRCWSAALPSMLVTTTWPSTPLERRSNSINAAVSGHLIFLTYQILGMETLTLVQRRLENIHGI